MLKRVLALSAILGAAIATKPLSWGARALKLPQPLLPRTSDILTARSRGWLPSIRSLTAKSAGFACRSRWVSSCWTASAALCARKISMIPLPYRPFRSPRRSHKEYLILLPAQLMAPSTTCSIP